MKIARSFFVAAALSGIAALAACTPTAAQNRTDHAAMPAMMQPQMAQMMRTMCEQKPPQISEPLPGMPSNDAMQDMMRQHMAMMREMCAQRTGSAGSADPDAMRGMMDQHMKQMQQMMSRS